MFTAPYISLPEPVLVRPRLWPPPATLSVRAPLKVNVELSPPTVSVLGLTVEEFVKKPVPVIWLEVWLKPARSKPEATSAVSSEVAGRLSLFAQRMTPPETLTPAPFMSAWVEGVPRTRTPLPVFVSAVDWSVRPVIRPPLKLAVTP